MPKLKNPLRYHGSKGRIADWVIAQFPPHKVYVEPYGGGASVMLLKPRAWREVYNDSNRRVVNLFWCIRHHPEALARAIYWTPYSRDEYEAAFESCLPRFPFCGLGRRIEDARRLFARLWLSNTNKGGARVNDGFKKDDGDKPVSRYHTWVKVPFRIFSKWNRIEDARRFVLIGWLGMSNAPDKPGVLQTGLHRKRKAITALRERNFARTLEESGGDMSRGGPHERIADAAERFRGVIIENRDALKVMREHDGPDTLHYVDPPYVPETRVSKAGYGEHEMSVADHERLLEFLRGLEGKVVLSGYPSDLYDSALSDWRRIETTSRTLGASRAEVLWMNFEPPKEPQGKLL